MDKKILGAILMAKKPSSLPDSEPKDDSDMGLESASSDILDAIDSKDSKALSDALKSFVEMCGSKDYKSDDEE